MQIELPLSHFKILEFEGNASSQICGMILKDYGADVIFIYTSKKVNENYGNPQQNYINRGKRSLFLNINNPDDITVQLLAAILKKVHAIIDPFNILDTFEMNYEKCIKINPEIIIENFTHTHNKPNNYSPSFMSNNLFSMSYSGFQSIFGTENHTVPFTNLSDIAGGIFAALGILISLYHKLRKNQGANHIEISVSDALLSLGIFIHSRRKLGLWSNPRGKNMLDSGAPFYQCYKTSDEKYMAIGCLEPKFFDDFISRLELGDESKNELISRQYDEEYWPQMKELFKKTMLTKTQKEWIEIFGKSDACASPVLEIGDLASIKHFQDRKDIVNKSKTITSINDFEISPSPKLSLYDFGYNVGRKSPQNGEHTYEILKELNVDADLAQKILKKYHLECEKVIKPKLQESKMAKKPISNSFSIIFFLTNQT